MLGDVIAKNTQRQLFFFIGLGVVMSLLNWLWQNPSPSATSAGSWTMLMSGLIAVAFGAYLRNRSVTHTGKLVLAWTAGAALGSIACMTALGLY